MVPTNANRVRLMTVVPSRNDYINAVFLDVSPYKNAMIFGPLNLLSSVTNN